MSNFEDIKCLVKDDCCERIATRAIILSVLREKYRDKKILRISKACPKENGSEVIIDCKGHELELYEKDDKKVEKLRAWRKIKKMTLTGNTERLDIKITPSNENDSLSKDITSFYKDIICIAKEELKEESKHLTYEFSMLVQLYEQVKMHVDLVLATTISNAILESWRTHARALITFFREEKGYFDEAWYKDYFCKCLSENTSSSDPNIKLDVSDVTVAKLNLATEHLSYIRSDTEKELREPSPEEIEKVMERYVRALNLNSALL